MKTIKVLKGILFFIMFCAIFSGFTIQNALAQTEEKAKAVRIKVIKDKDGVITEIDTSFESFDATEIEKIIYLNDFEGDVPKDIEEKISEITMDLDIIVDDAHCDSLIKCHVIKLRGDKSDSDCHKVIIKDVDGATRMKKNAEGVFIINPGNEKMVDVYIEEMIGDVKGEISKDSIKIICIKSMEADTACSFKVMMEDCEHLDKGEGMTKTMTVKMDDATIWIATKVMILDIEEDDLEEMEEDSGIKIVTKNQEPLEIENLDFYPNPNTGQFKLSFNLENKSNTDIKIYDMGGRVVYSEKLKGFSGSYEKLIDISGNANGTYFLHVSQGKAAMVKKIVLQ